MIPIQPHCRDTLTAKDLEWVAELLSSNPSGTHKVRDLLTEETALDAALESDQLFRTLIESPALLAASPRLYFYVLTRHVLPEFERVVADYVASVLAAFLEARQWQSVPGHPELVAEYVTDLWQQMAQAPESHRFYLQVHLGNWSLFISGLFPERIRHRSNTHGAPGIAFYEDAGRTGYRLAADHHLAREHDLAPVYRTMADRFSEVRVDLNQLAERLLCLDSWGN